MERKFKCTKKKRIRKSPIFTLNRLFLRAAILNTFDVIWLPPVAAIVWPTIRRHKHSKWRSVGNLRAKTGDITFPYWNLDFISKQTI